MQFILLASFALACAASPLYGTGNIAVTGSGGYIVTSPNGFQVAIQGPLGTSGREYFQIAAVGPNLPLATFPVSQSLVGPQQSALAEIFNEYRGAVSGPQYEAFLGKIATVSPQLYQLLQSLNQPAYGLATQQYPDSGYYSSLWGKILGASYVPALSFNQPQSLWSKYQQYPYGQNSWIPQGSTQSYLYGQQYNSVPIYLQQLLGQYGSIYPYYYPNLQSLPSIYPYNIPQSQLLN